MADNFTGGVKVFQDTALEALEDKINTFLSGTGDANNTRKLITQSPTVVLSGGVFYTIIVYKTI